MGVFLYGWLHPFTYWFYAIHFQKFNKFLSSKDNMCPYHSVLLECDWEVSLFIHTSLVVYCIYYLAIVLNSVYIPNVLNRSSLTWFKNLKKNKTKYEDKYLFSPLLPTFFPHYLHSTNAKTPNSVFCIIPVCVSVCVC